MTLTQVKPENVNQEIKITGEIINTKPPEPRIETAIFQCESCMRPHELKQNPLKKVYKPLVCHECGGRTFKLVPEESTYTEIQELIVPFGERKVRIYLRGELCNPEYKFLDRVIAYGVLRVMLCNDEPNYYYIEATACNKRRK